MQQMLWDGFSLVSFTGTPFFLHILTLLWTDMCKTLYIIKASNGENSFFFFHYLGNIKKTKKRREGEKRPEPVTVVGGVTKKPSTKLSTVIITTDQIPVVLSKWRGD